VSVVTIHKAKTNLSQLIKKVSAGEEVIIARGDKLVARLVPIGELNVNQVVEGQAAGRHGIL
jgi:prevent-host-death family protein